MFRDSPLVLCVGFGAVIACMLGSLYIGFQYLELTRSAWQRDTVFREKVRAAFLMREAIRERSLYLAVTTTLDDFFDRDAQRATYNAKAVNFILARDKLLELGVTRPEKNAMEAVIVRISQLRTSIDGAMDLVVESGNNAQALSQMQVALAGQMQVIGEINDFIQVVEREAKREAGQAARDIKITRRKMLLLSGYAVALAAIIGIMVIVREGRNTRRLRRHRDKLAALSSTDALTSLANRRRFDEFLAAEWSRASRSGASLSLIMVDIDHFKSFNDEYGHAEGDTCLAEVAKAMHQVVLRSSDLLARYGGEEFACVLPETSVKHAHAIAQKLHQAVAALNWRHERSPTADYVTVSIGVATMTPHPADAVTDLFKTADRNLYQAKDLGRNRVVCPIPTQWSPAASR